MTAGEENAAAPQVTQDAGSIRVLTPLPYTRLREGERVVAAEFGASSSSLLPRSVVPLDPGCLQPGLQQVISHLPGGLALWELCPCCSTSGCWFQTVCSWGDRFNLLHKQLLCLGSKKALLGACDAVALPSQPHLTLQYSTGTSATLSNSHVLICLYSLAYRTESCEVLFPPHLSCVSYCLTISL